MGVKVNWEEKKLIQEGFHLLVKEIILLVRRDHTVLPHFAVITGGSKNSTTGFGVQLILVYTLILIFLLLHSGTSSERILHGPTNLKTASPTNIDINFKSRGLKWNGKDAVSTL